MLQLLLGRSGSGKTHTIYEQLCDLAWSGNEGLILLVPEQFSFESERILLRRLGPRMADRIKVLSFTRMADQVFRETGGLAGRRMDDATRALLLSRALEIVKDQLTLYRRTASDSGAVSTVLAMTTELKQCGVKPIDLEKTASKMKDCTLQRKTHELALITGAYDAVTAGVTDNTDSPSYIDPMDDLTALSERLPDSKLAAGAYIFVDSFKGFTAPEFQVLRVLIKQAKRVTVALCADGIEDKSAGYGLFSPVINTASRLRDMARKDGVTVAKVKYCNENLRSKSAALKAAEAGLFSSKPFVYDKKADEVTITACTDIYDECDFVAREIRRRLREYNGRCRDFAIVARDLENYRGVLNAAMEKQGIPFVMDERSDILTEPLVTLVLSALDTIIKGFSTDDILRLLKTGLAGFSTHSVALIENYALTWRINGARWRSEWTGNPNGLDVKADNTSNKQLWYLNLLRHRLVRPLERLRSALFLKDADCKDFSKAIYQYLIDIRADKLTKLRVSKLDSSGEPALAERMARMWDITMEILDKLAVVCEETSYSPARLTELFRLTASLTDLGELPQSLDAVQIGSADRIRFSSPKTVFIIGANEGIFPAYPVPSGILNDNERRELISLGISLTDTADGRAVVERFLAYTAVSAPSENLIISYVKGNALGEALAPSVLVESLKRILPLCNTIDNELSYSDPFEIPVESEHDAFELTAALWGKATPLAAGLKYVFDSKPEYRQRIQALNSAAQHKPAFLNDNDTIKELFGDNMWLSASRIESYHRCRFSYFCQYGLKAKPRRTADLDALAFGTLTHWVMEHILPEYAKLGFDYIERERVFSDTACAVRKYADEVMGGLEDKPARFTALLKRLAGIAGALLWQVVYELRQSSFVPVDYELNVGLPDETGNPSIPPVVLTLPDGGKVRVQGKIDRVDIYKRNGVSFIRVVDYKTGRKEFKLSDIIEGINVQMLIYLFAIWQNGSKRYGNVTPAGVLYLPAKLPVVNVERNADEKSIKRTQIKELRMSGLLLDNPDIICAMESEAAGLFIPAKTDKKGEIAKGSAIASLNQFGQLKKCIENLLIKMAQTLREGDISALPTAGEVDACEYCDYHSVCGHEQDDPVRFLKKRDNKEIFKELDKNLQKEN